LHRVLRYREAVQNSPHITPSPRELPTRPKRFLTSKNRLLTCEFSCHFGSRAGKMTFIFPKENPKTQANLRCSRSEKEIAARERPLLIRCPEAFHGIEARRASEWVASTSRKGRFARLRVGLQCGVPAYKSIEMNHAMKRRTP